jgi:hypothetical protein
MPSRKGLVAGGAMLLASFLVLMAGRKHYYNVSHSETALVTEDKFGIPISEDEDGVSATEMEQTDLLMLHTVQQLESKVNSLSKQMKQVTGNHNTLGIQPSSSELQAKVTALGTSMLDTIKAVQHLSAQVSQLEISNKLNRQQILASADEMIQPQSDAAAFITDTSGSPDAKLAVTDVEAGTSLSKDHPSQTQTVVAKKMVDISKVLSRLASDVALASSVIGKQATAKPAHSSRVDERSKPEVIQNELKALHNMMIKASNLLQATKMASSRTIGSRSPIRPSLAIASATHQRDSSSSVAPPLSQSAAPSPPKSVETAALSGEDGIAYDAPSTFSSDLLSDSLGSSDLKNKVATMQVQVQALARRERSALDALPILQNQISRDRAVLSDGLQSLEIAQDRLVLAGKAAEEIGAGSSAEQTKVLAEKRESAIQAEVTAELHRLAQAKRAAAEGPRLARTLHERRAQLRRLESELQRATLLEKARHLESTKDFAG